MSAGKDSLSIISDILVIEIANCCRNLEPKRFRRRLESSSGVFLFGLMPQNRHHFKFSPIEYFGRQLIGPSSMSDNFERTLRFLRPSDKIETRPNVFFKKRFKFFRFRSRNLIKSAIMDNDFMKNLESTQVITVNLLN